MVESVTRKVPARGAAVRENLLPPLRITYFKRMKANKVYPVEVCWKKAERGMPGKEVTLRLVMAGCQVSPTEQKLNPGDPEARTTFYVTPLARGKLRHHHLDVWYGGRKIQEIPLAAKAVNQRWTRFFLIMTFLVPCLLLYYCKYYPFQEEDFTAGETLEKYIADNVPAVPGLVKEKVPEVETWLKEGRSQLAQGYDALVDLCQDKNLPIPFYACLTFFGLALVSSWWHGERRKRRLTDPIPIPAAALRQGEEG